MESKSLELIKKYQKQIFIVVFGIFLITSALIVGINQADDNGEENSSETNRITNDGGDTIFTNNNDREFDRFGLNTNTSESLIDLDLVLNGGPGKDGIPSIDEPEFISVNEVSSNLMDETRGILFEHNGVQRFYPYNVLVWHEIVNDSIDDLDFAITFCPLCGSAIAYNREINGEVSEFGVSGLLYQSNLLMYDRNTESLWSQIEGRSVVGDLLETELEILPIQVLDFVDVKDIEGLEILSENTGFRRNYDVYPYDGYDESEELIFPVAFNDQRLFAKEIMFAVNAGDIPVAFRFEKLKEEGSAEITLENGEVLTATSNGTEVEVQNSNSEVLPGFFTQWFSWANHNLPDGVNPEAKGEVWGI